MQILSLSDHLKRISLPVSKEQCKDLQAGVDVIYDGYRYKESVRPETVHILSRFYLWLTSDGYSKLGTGELKVILKLSFAPGNTKSCDHVLTRDEIVSRIKRGILRWKELLSLYYLRVVSD